MLMGNCQPFYTKKNEFWICSKQINPYQVDLSHFKLVAIIGSGGFAKVFQAVNRITGDVVAIKVMDKTRIAKSKTFSKSVWTERDIMCSTKNDFLLPLICSFQTFYECYMVVPFMPGSDITHYSRSHYYLSESQVRFYFAQLYLAVECLHEKNIVHRDIKPRNMLLDADGNMRLCDFGLSYQFKKENEVLKNVAGTDSYNAPEMINKQTYRFSVDIWSMGVCLFEMIFRKRPYKSDENMINCHQKNIELNFPDFIPSSDSVRNLLNRMLQFRPKNRIGCGPNGVKELKEHPWLRSIDWESIRSRKLKPPFVPREEKRGTTMVDKNIFHKDNQKRGNSGFLDSGAQQRFQGFEYNVALHSEDHAMLPPPVRKKNEKRILRTDLSKLFKESLKPRHNF